VRRDLVQGSVFPDFEVPDQDGVLRNLSGLQGDNVMVLLLGRGEHCQREYQHQQEMVKFHEWCPVAFTSLVTVLPNDLQDVNKMRHSTGATWPFLADVDLQVQRSLEIEEYTDTQHNSTVPHTILLAPGLLIDKVYVGYWFGAVRPRISCGRICRTSSAESSRTSTPLCRNCAPSGKPLGRRLRSRPGAPGT
jgi:peroxiredoxin